MQLRPLLAIAASCSIAFSTYACQDTFPSQLSVYTPVDGGIEGLADTSVPLNEDAGEAGSFPVDGGEGGSHADAGSHADGGDAGPHSDAGDAGESVDGGDAAEVDSSTLDADDDAG